MYPHLIIELCRNVGVKWNQKEEVRASKGLIDDVVVVKIQSDTAEVVPRPAGPSQPQPGTAHDRINHMEQYLQSQFTYLNQYHHSMVQYMQNSNQAWSHMFHDCAQALYVDTSGWPAMPQFQPPHPPINTDANIQAQQEKEAALAADDSIRDL